MRVGKGSDKKVFFHFSISGTKQLRLMLNKRLRYLHSAYLRKCGEIGTLVARDTVANHRLSHIDRSTMNEKLWLEITIIS